MGPWASHLQGDWAALLLHVAQRRGDTKTQNAGDIWGTVSLSSWLSNSCKGWLAKGLMSSHLWQRSSCLADNKQNFFCSEWDEKGGMCSHSLMKRQHVCEEPERTWGSGVVTLLPFYFTVCFCLFYFCGLRSIFLMLVFNVYLLFNEPRLKMSIYFSFLWVIAYNIREHKTLRMSCWKQLVVFPYGAGSQLVKSYASVLSIYFVI